MRTHPIVKRKLHVFVVTSYPLKITVSNYTMSPPITVQLCVNYVSVSIITHSIKFFHVRSLLLPLFWNAIPILPSPDTLGCVPCSVEPVAEQLFLHVNTPQVSPGTHTSLMLQNSRSAWHVSHYYYLITGTIHDMSAVSYIETAHTLCEVLDEQWLL